MGIYKRFSNWSNARLIAEIDRQMRYLGSLAAAGMKDHGGMRYLSVLQDELSRRRCN